MTQAPISTESAVRFLEEMARYWDRRLMTTPREDAEHWAHVYNAEACRKIAALIQRGAA